MIEEYIWRSEQVTAEDNPMSTLIVSFYENKQEAECGQGRKEPDIYSAHINRAGILGIYVKY
jgi:hypothetical protein